MVTREFEWGSRAPVRDGSCVQKEVDGVSVALAMTFRCGGGAMPEISGFKAESETQPYLIFFSSTYLYTGLAIQAQIAVWSVWVCVKDLPN